MGWDWGMGGTLGAVGAENYRANGRRCLESAGEARRSWRGVGSGGERLAGCLVGLVLATLRVVSPTPDWILYWEQAFV